MAVTYEQAKKKALAAQSNLDTVIEYESAYVFYNSKARGNNKEDNGIAIDKKSGKEMTTSEYIYRAIDTNESEKPVKKATKI